MEIPGKKCKCDTAKVTQQVIVSCVNYRVSAPANDDSLSLHAWNGFLSAGICRKSFSSSFPSCYILQQRLASSLFFFIIVPLFSVLSDSRFTIGKIVK